MTAPLFIIGDQGMLGRAFRERLTREQRAFIGLDLPTFDAADPAAVAKAFACQPSAVINCAAYTNVDKAETDEAHAVRGNTTAPQVLAAECAHHGIPLVHFSTDYVFAGNAITPYSVEAPLNPLGAYGRTKASGETAIRHSGCAHLILRTSWLYAPWSNNFVRTMARLTAEKPSLKVVDDQRGRPTSAEHLAGIALTLLDRGMSGTWHVTDGGECTWYEFTVEIARLLGRTCTIFPCTTADFPRPAPRPTYSVLDLSQTEALLGPMPHWKSNLADILRRLEST